MSQDHSENELKIQIISVKKSDKSVLRNLLEYYCYDSSEYLHWDVNDHGKFEYPNLDTYWIEPDRYPYFIKVDGHYAGFVLINKVFKILKESNGHAIAEFFILRKYRRNKIGSIAANAVFKMYPGWWEISPIMQNKASFDFWLKVAKENAVEKYYLEKSEENGLQKQVIIFNNS